LRRVAPHSWIPWAIATVALAVFAPLFVVQLLFVGAGTDLIWATIMIVLASGLLIVGALISSRQPENSIGLLLLGSGLLSVVGVAGAPIAVIAQERFGETGPLLVLLGWIGSWSSSPLLVLLVVILPLIFPNGQLISPRWVPALVLAIGMAVGATFRDAFGPRLVGATDNLGIVNPFAIGEPVAPWLVAAGTIADVLGPLALGLGVVSVIVRFRRSTGIERAQLKWFVLVASIASGALIIGIVSPVPTIGQAGWIVGLSSIAVMPIVIGLAVIRYRLFEIDRVISRTVAYALLTLALAATYLAGFAAAQGILGPFTSTGGPVAVAASTLIVFAVFQPLRRRLKAAADRRFNRSRYDAQRTVEAFAAGLRNEVEIARLGDELRAVVGLTLAPRSVSVWLRSQGPDR
jgi:hypothetical protein